jgi:hypothetical protein
MRFRPRFTLKVLMLFVAAVGIFCAYHANWIKQRHELLAEISAQKDELWKGRVDLTGHVFFDGKLSSFNLLWLFGEPRYDWIELNMFQKQPDEVDDDDNLLILYKQELERAKRLFPEARISLTVNRKWPDDK